MGKIESKRLRIVQVAPDFYPVPPKNYGGIERVIYALVENLVELGHEVFLYAAQGSKCAANLIPYCHQSPNPNAIADYVAQTLPDAVDIIHDHTHHSVVGKRLLPIPTVCSIHDRLNNSVENPIYLSKRALDVVGEGKGFYAYNGIDIKEYEFTDTKQDYLLFLGVLNWHKGLHHALDIAERTKQKLFIAGPVFNREFYEKNVEPRIQNNPNVQYVGEVGGQQRSDLLRNAKCMLFPTSWEEPFGLVMIEAMACGTPVLGLANGAVPEVLRGFPELICQSVEEMAEKVEQARFPDPYSMREYVASRFSTGIMTEKYLEIYREAIRTNEHIDEQPDFTSRQFEYANWLKSQQLYDQAVGIYQRLIDSRDTPLDMKLCACDRAADIYYNLGNDDKEREFVWKALQFDTPRAEFCCRLGYQFLSRNAIHQAIFWYKLAAELEKPKIQPKLYYEACWTWLPHIQLCICYYRLGDFEKSYEQNEIARVFQPNDMNIQNNKILLEGILQKGQCESITQSIPVSVKNSVGRQFQMALSLPGYLEETIIKRGSWEPHLSRVLSRFVKKDSVFLDIGSNIGFHSLYVASEHPDVTILSFEPHPVIFEQLKRNVQLNSFSNLIPHQTAVGDCTGSGTFYMQNEHSYNRGMSGMEYYDLIGNQYQTLPVQVISLDEFLTPKIKSNISVMKIDTQGYEYEVLKGSLEIIQKSKPVITFEHHSYAGRSFSDVHSLLPEYEIFKLQPWTGEIQPLNGADPQEFLHDYICLPDWARALQMI